ncbi:hypothetical protein BYT27DRAFT_7209608 [Phlegmacium glaucopus]|nr:hypothetical protein BYT27DRAFT_7209608 [Phlegmacium glaucopus]
MTVHFNRPVPKGKTKREQDTFTNFHGKPANCINDSVSNVDRITTWSVTGIQKKKLIPDDNCIAIAWYTAFRTDFYSFASPERKAENDEDEDEISDDWDEEEMQLAFSKSRQISKHDDKFTGGSKSHIADDGDEDPFIDINMKNVMPVPPSKPKKVYLEDFDNFTIK